MRTVDLVLLVFNLQIWNAPAQQQQQQQQLQNSEGGQACPRVLGRDHVMIQKSLKHELLKINSSSGGRSDGPNFDYDCDGDGNAECGVWDFQLGMCANKARCSHQYRFGDWTLNEACRCRRCSQEWHDGTAVTDGELRKLGVKEWGRWENWADHLGTCAPWMMPRNDKDLQSLLAYARSKGYKIRISGAAHSAGGLVTDGQDNMVVVLSLAEYKAPTEWEFQLTTGPDGSKRVFVNAGWTQLHLYAKIRPLGYFLPAQTAGYFFSLGGIVGNSVHGGGYQKGFVHSYVTRMRVMKYDGRIEMIDKEDDLRYWRNSFGLLGIILGVEFQLEERKQLQMYTHTRKLANWSAEELWKFIKMDAEADLPSDIVAEGGSAGSRKSWNGEFFLDFVNSENPSIAVYAQKANSSVDAKFSPREAPDWVNIQYEHLLSKMEKNGAHGYIPYGDAARHDGVPPLQIMGVDVNDMLKNMKHMVLAQFLSDQALKQIPDMVGSLRWKVNDGFFLTHAPAALAGAYFIEPSKAFEAMDYFRSRQRESLKGKPGVDFMWNLPGEFRFVKVTDSAVLQPVPAGLWFNANCISMPQMSENEEAWKMEFAKVEAYWVNKLGAKPHMGKLWGFEKLASGEILTFSDHFASEIYPDAAKEKFTAYMKKSDPEGLFASGLGLKVLAKGKRMAEP